MSDQPESKALESLAANMHRAMLKAIADQLPVRFECSEGMPPEMIALIKQLERNSNNDQ